MGLRHAADRQRVLEVARRAGTPQRAVLEQVAQPRHRGRLPAVGPHPRGRRMDHRQVGRERLEAQRGRDLHALDQVGGVDEHERAAAHRHAVGADQPQRLLGPERDRLEPGAASASSPGAVSPSYSAQPRPISTLPMSAISDRSPWPTEPTIRTIGWTPGVEQRHQQLDQLAAHTDAGLEHPVDARDHHRPDDVGGQRAAVGGDLVGDGGERERADLLERDVVARERAETGVEPVDRLAAGQHPVDDVARGAHAPSAPSSSSTRARPRATASTSSTVRPSPLRDDRLVG